MKRLLLLVLLLIHLPVGASTVLQVDLATQIDRADLIFLGTVVSAEAVATRDGNFAFTYVTFDVEDTFKGAAPHRLVTLRVAGGDVGMNAFDVSGAPRFATGGRHVLFVEGNDRLGVPLVGWYWGKLDVVADPASQQAILVDHTGRTIDGIEGNDWKRGARAMNAPKVSVVSESGVKIQLDEPSARGRIVQAASVLDQLQSMVASRRASSADFRKATAFQSASKANVPATFVFEATRAREK